MAALARMAGAYGQTIPMVPMGGSPSTGGPLYGPGPGGSPSAPAPFVPPGRGPGAVPGTGPFHPAPPSAPSYPANPNANAGQYGNLSQYPPAVQQGIQAQMDAWRQFWQGGAAAVPVGQQQLLKLLQSGGQVDPGLMNQMLAANSQGTQNAQLQAQQMMAQTGFGNSGTAQALNAAIGQAGQNRAANIRYQNAADSYNRLLQTLGTLYQNQIGPMASIYGIDRGVGIQQQALAQQSRNNQMNMLGSLAGSAGSILGALAIAGAL